MASDPRHPLALPDSPLACVVCEGFGSVYVDGSGCNDYDCGACDALGFHADRVTALQVEALLEDEARTEDAWLAAEEAYLLSVNPTEEVLS